MDAVGVKTLQQTVLDFDKCDVQVLLAAMTSMCNGRKEGGREGERERGGGGGGGGGVGEWEGRALGISGRWSGKGKGKGTWRGSEGEFRVGIVGEEGVGGGLRSRNWGKDIEIEERVF